MTQMLGITITKVELGKVYPQLGQKGNMHVAG